jgi:hypothetical protein
MPHSHVVTLLSLAAGSLVMLSWPGGLRAQPPGGDKAVNSAISDAVQGGESRYRPLTPAQTRAAQNLDVQCRDLAEKLNAMPRKRKYDEGGRPVENAQGRSVATVERDKSRKSLEAAYKAKCTE